MSSSGPTVEAAIRSLREAVARDTAQVLEGTGGGVGTGGTTRTAMGLLFYTRCGGENDALADGLHRHVLEDERQGTNGVREELSQLHGRLPFVDHIIGESCRKKAARVPERTCMV